ncbi:MAG TPA: hypothetical protein VFJ85_09430 [Acidimicrobiales bacterium]|nr:hypothetical protein [Acidimicrobiales bacterium]
MTAIATRSPARQAGARLRAASRTTPGRYRLWSLATGAVLVLATLTAGASAAEMRSATRRAETTSGPVLVATQELVSSLAEADAAATAAFLSGRDEDPEQRRLYEQALARADQQVEEIAALAGRDAALRTHLDTISVALTRYAGLVEAARASNRSGTADANAYLVSAVKLAEELVQGDAAGLADDARSALVDDEAHRQRALSAASLALVVGIGLLAAGQVVVFRGSRRLVNPPLLVATALVAAGLVWLLVAHGSTGRDMAEARRHGYDSIALTAQLGNAGFGAKAAETLALITGDGAQWTAADASAAQVAAEPVNGDVALGIREGRPGGAPGGLLGQAAEAADSPRERAAVAEAALRWQRFQTTIASLRKADAATARAVAVGPASADFNGFNFSVQSILGQNRDQFLAGLSHAADGATRLPRAVPLLLLVALAAMFWGFQLRINDYR